MHCFVDLSIIIAQEFSISLVTGAHSHYLPIETSDRNKTAYTTRF